MVGLELGFPGVSEGNFTSGSRHVATAQNERVEMWMCRP